MYAFNAAIIARFQSLPMHIFSILSKKDHSQITSSINIVVILIPHNINHSINCIQLYRTLQVALYKLKRGTIAVQSTRGVRATRWRWCLHVLPVYCYDASQGRHALWSSVPFGEHQGRDATLQTGSRLSSGAVKR